MSRRNDKRLQHFFDELGQHETDKALKKARRQLKNNRPARSPRQRDWLEADLDDVPDERIIPRGEQERRHRLQHQAIAEDTADSAASAPVWPDGEQGRVVEVSSGLCRVALNGQQVMCSWRGALATAQQDLPPISVGDEVMVTLTGSGQGVVEAVLPRRTVLARPNVGNQHRQQVIVANADQLLVVAAWRNPHFWPELVDRYLITAERNNLRTVICVNKVDLAADQADVQAALQPYLSAGYEVLYTSVVNQRGIDALRRQLHNRTTVLAGLSGVGKSSLVNAVQPGLQLRTASVNADSGDGRHTTTQASWYPLGDGGAVVDTPGIREFGLTGLPPADLARYYPEFVALAYHCRFNNCTHRHEPDCAVRTAVDQGRLAAVRYHNYQKIFESL